MPQQQRTININPNRPVGQVINPLRRNISVAGQNFNTNTMKDPLALPPNLPKGLSIQRAGALHSTLIGSGNTQHQNINRKRPMGNSVTGPLNKTARTSGSNV